MLNSFSLLSALRVNLSSAPSFPQKLIKSIDKLWAEELKLKPYLFNGKFFSVKNYLPNESLIYGYFSDYKNFLAYQKHPELFESHQHPSPLAVTVVLENTSSFIMGKRGMAMNQDAGLWEFCPSGGVELNCYDHDIGTINFEKQVYSELKEELSLLSQDISALVPFCLIESTVSGVWDICFSANLLYPLKQKLINQEYSEFKFIPKEQLKVFYSSNIQGISAVSGHIIEKFLLK